MILRFMGDLPEPKAPAATPEVKEHGSLARRLKGSIGKKFGSSNRLSELAAEVNNHRSVSHHCSYFRTRNIVSLRFAILNYSALFH